jgi:hypothetical protein
MAITGFLLQISKYSAVLTENQETLFYYGRAHDVKVTIKDCQRRDHLLFGLNHFFK